MEIPPALLQFLASLGAILVLAAIAWRLKLGPEPKLVDSATVLRAAQEVEDGLEPVAAAIDRSGRGALVLDEAGRVLLLRPHGTHFAGRFLTERCAARIDDETLLVESGERRFGSVALTLDDPSAWVRHIDAIKSRSHA